MINGSFRGMVPSQRIMKYVKNAPPVTGDINVETNLSYDEKGLNVKSDLSINKGTVREIPLRELKAHLTFAKGKATLRSNFTLAESYLKLNGNVFINSGRYEMAGEVDKITLPWLKQTNAVMAHGFKVSTKGGGNLKKSTYKGTLSAGGTGEILEGEDITRLPSGRNCPHQW
jgi:hypothetical protein